MKNSEWQRPTTGLKLAGDQIDIWLADLDAVAENAAKLRQILSADEQDRAARFVRAADRDRYIAARAILRQLLARYMSVPANRLEFAYQAKGKPYLPLEANRQHIEFNLAHSGSIALYAFNQAQPVGIDVEQVKASRDLEQMARYILSPAEISLFAAGDPAEQVALFYRLWTCKEAVIKQTGAGLDAIRNIEIPLHYKASAEWLKPIKSVSMLREITSIPGYAAALAVAQQSRINFLRVEPGEQAF